MKHMATGTTGVLLFLFALSNCANNLEFSSRNITDNKATEDGKDRPLSLGYKKAQSDTNAFRQKQTITNGGSYKSNANQVWTINRPGASGISLHFKDFSTEKNFDKVHVYGLKGERLATYHGDIGSFWTPVFPGESLTIELESDESVEGTGFIIDEVHFNPGANADKTWEEKETVVESAHPYPALDDSVYTINQPGAGQISVHFKSIELEDNADYIYLFDKNGNLYQTLTGTIENKWSVAIPGDQVQIGIKSDWAVQKNGFTIDRYKYSESGEIVDFTESLVALHSAHNYSDDFENTWTLSAPGASHVRVHFNRFITEEDKDIVTILNGDGQEVATYSGVLGQFWTDVISGDTVKIRLESDGGTNFWGFHVDLLAHAGGTAPAPPTHERYIFDKVVAVGDSICHSFQSGSVEETRQPKSYCNVFAKQATGEILNNPLLVYPGFPVQGEDIFKGDCGVFCVAKALVPKRKLSSNANVTNFAVTGASSVSLMYQTGECVDYRFRARKWSWTEFKYVETCEEESDKLNKLTLLDGGDQVSQAVAKNPSFVLAWFANNDSLSTALHTDPSAQTEFGVFKNHIDKIFNEFIAIEARGFTASTPNVTTIRYLVEHTDSGGNDSLSGLKAFYNPTVKKAHEVLDADEVAYITSELEKKNEYLRQKAVALGWAYTDFYTLFDNIVKYGQELKDGDGNLSGTMVHATWPTSEEYGIFSLDGVHPNNTGHCLAANHIIDSVNSQYSSDLGQTIPYCDEMATLAEDSLNQDPVDIPDFLENNIFGQMISALVDLLL